MIGLDPRVGAKNIAKTLPRQRFGAPNTIANPRMQAQAWLEYQRRGEEILEAASAPLRTVAKPRQPIPITGEQPDLAAIIDRFHKFGRVYVTVSPIHFAGMDPIEDPAAFHNIMDAVVFAREVLAPLFDPLGNERIVIEIHGGLYEEVLVLPADVVDLQGIGQVVVQGVHNILPGTIGNSNQITLKDITLWNPSDNTLPALVVAPMGDYPATTVANINIDRCWIHGVGGGIWSPATRINAWRSVFETDYESSSYLNIDMPAVRFGQTITNGYTMFEQCDIIGVHDRRVPAGANGFPNKGRAIQLDGIHVAWNLSGVVFAGCRIEGYGVNECWNLVFDHCQIYGGKKHATAGTLFLFLIGDSDVLVKGEVEFDHCKVACRYLVEESDMGTIPTNGMVVERILYTKQMSYSGLDSSVLTAGSTCWNIFGTFGNGIMGDTHVVHSATWREYWNFNGVGEAAITNINSDVLVPIIAVTCRYTHWG